MKLGALERPNLSLKSHYSKANQEIYNSYNKIIKPRPLPDSWLIQLLAWPSSSLHSNHTEITVGASSVARLPICAAPNPTVPPDIRPATRLHVIHLFKASSKHRWCGQGKNCSSLILPLSNKDLSGNQILTKWSCSLLDLHLHHLAWIA